MKNCLKALLSYTLATVSGLCLVSGVTILSARGIRKSGIHVGLRCKYQTKASHHRRTFDQRSITVWRSCDYGDERERRGGRLR